MLQVTNFLLRWLFLCRLVDDRAEVQTWPYRPPGYYEHPPPHSQPPQIQLHSQQHEQYNQQPQQHQQQHTDHKTDANMDIPTYRESVIRSLTSYPPGSSERLHRLEELRLQTVHEFAKQLVEADEVIRHGKLSLQQRKKEDVDDGKGGQQSSADASIGEKNYDVIGDTNDSSYQLHVDESIQDDLQQHMMKHHNLQKESNHHGLWKPRSFLKDSHHQRNEEDSTSNEAEATPSSSSYNPLQNQTPEQIVSSLTAAHNVLNECREMLPQLVSTVLHSPPALLPETIFPIDPISSLRSLLIHRCQTNPSLGIELCWLLEAEVGRKWKALFEHRQQTGKRLILIVQADIAAAIATIGAEKASAFNLLQDAEMATAFGVERTMETHHGYHGQLQQHQQQQQYGLYTDNSYHQQQQQQYGCLARPPQSISDLRCRHFGDSMHFVDRLTQISLDLRHAPPIHRQGHLQHRLAELNTRLCRRMLSRGQISIDVEEHQYYHQQQQQQQQYYDHGMGQIPQPPSWNEADIREDMIQHSVHLPMEPQTKCWPGGGIAHSASEDRSNSDTGGTGTRDSIMSDFEHPSSNNGVVRALRILPNNCRVLDSAQRCPFLVRMEVVETSLDANDARLYAHDVPGNGAGVTVQEALGSIRPYQHGGFDPCEIPPELIPETETNDAAQSKRESSNGSTQSASTSDRGIFTPRASNLDNKAVRSRGGYQGDGYYPPDAFGMLPDAFDMAREQYYEELHHNLRQQRENEYNSPNPSIAANSNQLSMGSILLDNVFGRPWDVECENIRQQSPFRDIKGWKVASFIIKAGEDIRKEALVMQIMSKLWTWFQEEIPQHLRPYLRPYTIMCVGGDAGIVECLPDVKSVSEVKKETDGFTTLRDFFERAFGPPVHPPYRPDYHQHQQPQQFGTVSFEKARDNFLRSLVGYSVVCYILQIKDRHNANVLMDREGHIMVSSFSI